LGEGVCNDLHVIGSQLEVIQLLHGPDTIEELEASGDR
jgi:hypothetical protein